MYIFQRKIENLRIFKLKYNCRRKSLKEKESVMVVWCGLKIPSLGITVRHYSGSLVMPNSYPRGGIFNPHLTTIKDSYNLNQIQWPSKTKDICYKIIFAYHSLTTSFTISKMLTDGMLLTNFNLAMSRHPAS